MNRIKAISKIFSSIWEGIKASAAFIFILLAISCLPIFCAVQATELFTGFSITAYEWDIRTGNPNPFLFPEGVAFKCFSGFATIGWFFIVYFIFVSLTEGLPKDERLLRFIGWLWVLAATALYIISWWLYLKGSFVTDFLGF